MATGAARGARRQRDWDQFSKEAIRVGIVVILARVGIVVRAEELVLESVDLPASTQRADLLFSGPDGLVIHVEVQQRPDPDMGVRMLEYFARILRSPQLAGRVQRVHQIVVQLSGSPMPTHHDFGGVVLDFRLVHAPSTPMEVFLQSPALAPFALTAGDPAAIDPVLKSIAGVEDKGLQTSLALLATFLGPGLRDTLMERMKGTTLIDTREEMLAEMRDTWLGRDLLTEGLERGVEQGRRAGVIDALSARFPDADPARIARTADRLAAQGDHPVRHALSLTHLDA